MRIQVVTIFPELFETFLTTSLLGRAIVERSLEVTVHDLRAFAEDGHSTVDDEPYGGGGGMVMKVEPWLRAVRELGRDSKPHRILLSPQGARFTDGKAQELARRDHMILLCGRYEGIDERVRHTVVDEELSIGDYVLSGGELPAMVVIHRSAIIRINQAEVPQLGSLIDVRNSGYGQFQHCLRQGVEHPILGDFLA